MPLTLLSLGFLVLSYLTRILRIFAIASEHTRDWLRIIPGDKFRAVYLFVERTAETKSSQTSRLVWLILKSMLKITYVLLKAVYEIHESMLWEVGFSTSDKRSNDCWLKLSHPDRLACGSLSMGNTKNHCTKDTVQRLRWRRLGFRADPAFDTFHTPYMVYIQLHLR